MPRWIRSLLLLVAVGSCALAASSAAEAGLRPRFYGGVSFSAPGVYYGHYSGWPGPYYEGRTYYPTYGYSYYPTTPVYGYENSVYGEPTYRYYPFSYGGRRHGW